MPTVYCRVRISLSGPDSRSESRPPQRDRQPQKSPSRQQQEFKKQPNRTNTSQIGKEWFDFTGASLKYFLSNYLIYYTRLIIIRYCIHTFLVGSASVPRVSAACCYVSPKEKKICEQVRRASITKQSQYYRQKFISHRLSDPWCFLPLSRSTSGCSALQSSFISHFCRACPSLVLFCPRLFFLTQIGMLPAYQEYHGEVKERISSRQRRSKRKPTWSQKSEIPTSTAISVIWASCTSG